LVALSRNVQGFDSRQRLGLWKGLLQLAISGGEIEAADTIAQAALDAIPNDLPLCELAFKAALRLKAPERAAARLDRIHRIQGPGPLWHFCRALQLAELPTTESPQYAEALNHLAEAARQRPAWSAVSMLQARIHDRLGDLPQATELYLKAFEHGASDASAVRRAVELLYAQQRYAEAGELLAAVHTRQHTGDADFQRMKSQLLGRLNQLDDALDLARNVAEQSQNYRDHLWLGNLLMVHGLRQRAEGLQDQSKRSLDEASAALKRAAKLEPTAPGPWVARVELLARTGRFEEAEQALADLQAHVAQEDAPRALANANVILGRFEQAQECFASALDAAPEDIGLIRTVAEFGMRTGRFELAEGPLRRLATGHIEATPQQRRWSRRALATWLAQTGRYPDLQEALRLVAENLAEEPSSVADRRAKADLLARHPRPSKRQEAAHLLEALVDSPQANDEDRWNLVQLHAAEQRWERAVPHLRVLSRPDALRMYVRYLIDSGALEEAKLRLRQLQRASPDDFATFAASTELSFHAGEIEEILRRIDRRSGDADTPAETLALIQLVDNYARQLTDNQSTMLAERFQSKAQTLLDAFLETHPENSLAAVAYLARWGQAERVLVMLEEALADRPGAQFAAAARDVVAPLASQPQAQGRLIDLLQRAAEKHGRTPQLLLLLATLHQAAERYDRLEAVYSELLKQQPENVLILNGLAELLALQNPQPRRALDLIDRAIRLGGPRPMFLDTRASVYRALGQPQKAIEDMEIVVAEAPRPNRYAHLAMAYAQANRPEQAKAAAEKAMGVDATMPGDEPEGQTAAPPVAEQLHPLERTAFADLLKRLK
jgi:tetratricopeptide (TPR) repeat protein